jgi:hypothetical protein
MLSFTSELDEHPKNINIKLKNHQLAMLKKCKNIENIINNNYGIMNDKPGTGKTYVILSLIYESKYLNKTNIIVVPQNIYTQWILSIENYSNNLTYKKFISYENIISLYNDPKILMENDIIITTSTYYHIISTTLESLNININRIFFDEIDTISNIICTKIVCDFIWFVSASFSVDLLGCYENFLKNNINILDITCKCENDFIDINIYLDNPNKFYYLCKNIYIDNILDNVISKKDIKCLNAMDYSKHNAKNEKELIDFLIQNKKSILEFDKIKCEDAIKNIELYEKFKNNYDLNIKLFTEELLKLNYINDLKNNILIYISNSDTYINNYLNVELEDKECEKIVKKSRCDEIKNVMNSFEDIIDILNNINNLVLIFGEYINNKKTNIIINNTILNLKKIVLIINNVYEILTKIKLDNIIKTKDYINNLLELLSNFENSIISNSQLEIYNKILNVSKKNIEINETKIKLIYDRLLDNNCCPVCYDIFDNKIYITSKCCNNKICDICVNHWYDMDKKTCIFCNIENVTKDDLIFFEKNIIEMNSAELNNNLINQEKIIFETKPYSKNIFLQKYVENLKNENKKIIIFSDYINIFEYIQKLCNENNIIYTDLDGGNIKDIDKSVNEYKFGNAKILLCNSKLFGCGMNFENSTDIIFVHKMDKDMENQVIGRAQRMGRKTILNVIYLEYENESTYVIQKPNNFYMNHFENNELEDFYTIIQYNNIIDNIQPIEFTNEIVNDSFTETLIENL